MDLCHAGQNYRRVRDEKVIAAFVEWLRARGHRGFEGKPWDWVRRRT